VAIVAIPIILLLLLLVALWLALCVWARKTRFSDSFRRHTDKRQHVAHRFYKCMLFTLFLM
jgi:hypothetical protein